MAGPCACVYLPPQASDVFLDRLHALLAEAALELRPTRKGRVWDAWFGRGPSGLTVPIHVCVESTLDGPARADAEEDLLNAGLWPDDYPLRVLLSAGCKGPEDWAAIRALLAQISTALGGVPTEPLK